MPLGDGTGPTGMGPMTGRAAGYCAGYPVPGFMNPYGDRFGIGRWNPYLSGGYQSLPYTGWGSYPAYPMPFWGGRRFSGFGFGRGRGRGWGRRGW
jgi:hypothetical protein